MMMRGEGFWPMMTSSQKPKFLVNYWGFTRNFTKFFSKSAKYSEFKIKFTYLNDILCLWLKFTILKDKFKQFKFLHEAHSTLYLKMCIFMAYILIGLLL